MSEIKKKVFCFSLDGLGFQLIEKLKTKNVMPYFTALIDKSSHGVLKSTDPPLTPTAWVSLFSGLNPGRHGIYDFVCRDKDGEFRIVNSSSSKTHMLWNLPEMSEMKVILLNQPITYPPYPVNGIMVSDHIFTPLHADDITYPHNVKKDISDLLGTYKLFCDIVYDDSRIDAALQEYNEEIAYKTKVFRYLNEKYDWNLFVYYLWGLDHLQHSMMHIIDSSHPRYKKTLYKKHYSQVLKYFNALDNKIREIVESLSKDTIILFVSDHGFSPVLKYIHLNTWLLEKKYIVLKRSFLTKIKYFMFKAGFTPQKLFNTVNHLIRFKTKTAMPMLNSRFYKFMRSLFLSFNDVDWEKTFFFSQGNYGQIYINHKRKGDKGDIKRSLERLVADLKLWSDTDTGEKIIDKIYFKDELYHGDKAELAQDILFYPADWKCKALGSLDFTSGKSVTDAFGITGYHDSHAVFICAGKNIRERNSLQNIRMEDVAPTILKLLGLPAPRHLDGRVIQEIFVEDNDIVSKEAADDVQPVTKDAGNYNYSDEEKAEIEAKLKRLGYL